MGTKPGAKVLPELTYWNSRQLEIPFAPLQKNRYVTFDVDQGGLSNIRLVFEYVACIAAITGRTLVLPPSEPWYLINSGPKHVGKREGVTSFSDIMDITALKQVIPVLSHDEFILESADHLSIPSRFRKPGFFQDLSTTQKPWSEWKRWLLENTRVAEDWDPYHTLICFPSKDNIDTDAITETYRDGRALIELTPAMNAAPVIHYPSDENHRSLGPVATMLAPSDDQLPKLTRRLIKNYIRYHPVIFEFASTLVSILGCYQYNALHIRRNDFQYKQTRAQADITWDNISALVCDDVPLYIATDEVDDAFRDYFRGRKAVFFWDDLMGSYTGPPIPEKYVGQIEQLICVCASRFIGTDLSTFSSYIVRLRGYCEAPDTASYYHTVRYDAPIEEADPNKHEGRNYLQENPLFWRDC